MNFYRVSNLVAVENDVETNSFLPSTRCRISPTPNYFILLIQWATCIKKTTFGKRFLYVGVQLNLFDKFPLDGGIDTACDESENTRTYVKIKHTEHIR